MPQPSTPQPSSGDFPADLPASGARCHALVVAAGTGSRAGTPLPKQYCMLAGKPVVRHALDSLAAHPAIDALTLVIGKGQGDMARAALSGFARPLALVEGGDTRQESVRNGLAAIAAAGGADMVLIHDAARPYLPAAVIDRLIAALDTHDGAIPVLPVVDSLVRGTGSIMEQPVPREGLWRVQTPQAFHFPVIWNAHMGWQEGMDATDDSRIAHAAGHDIALVEGDERLAKLTYPADFRMMDL